MLHLRTALERRRVQDFFSRDQLIGNPWKIGEHIDKTREKSRPKCHHGGFFVEESREEGTLSVFFLAIVANIIKKDCKQHARL